MVITFGYINNERERERGEKRWVGISKEKGSREEMERSRERVVEREW